MFGGGVALVISNKLLPMRIHLKTDIELVVAKICYPIEMYIMSIYRSPAYHMCDFAKTMTRMLKEFRYLQTCVVGDINEDILLTSEKQCCSMFCVEGFKQVVTKPTCDSRTLIDHVYVSNSLQIDSDVSDCYYSDHDHVLCAFNI